MNYKISNRVFFWTMLCEVLGAYLLLLPSVILHRTVEMNLAAETLISVIFIPIPAIAALVICREQERPKDVLRIHRIRPSSVLMLVLIVALMEPFTTILNLATQTIATNFAATEAATTSGLTSALVACIYCFLVPLIEETVFRGVVFHGYEKSCGFLTALIFSSLFFGLYHLNLNQLFYAIAIGIFLAMAVQATGSLLSSILMHMFCNIFGTLIDPLIMRLLLEEFGSQLLTDAGGYTVRFYVILVVLAVIFTPLAVLVMRRIAKREGRRDALSFRKEKGTETEEKSVSGIVTPSMVAGIVFALGFIVGLIIRTWNWT